MYGHDMTLLHTIFAQLSMETHRVHPRYFDQGYIDLNLQGPLTLSGLMPYETLCANCMHSVDIAIAVIQ